MNTIDTLLQSIALTRSKQMEQLLSEQLGIGLSQFRVLSTLSGTAIKQRKIADQLGQTEASISRQVKLLVERGFVGVRPDPTSRRQLLVGLTIKGTRVLQAAHQLLDTNFVEVSRLLNSKQQDQILDVLSTFKATINPEALA